MERSERVRQLFEAALERSPAERGGFLDAHCSDDPALREEVAALLQSADAPPRPAEHHARVPELAGSDLGNYHVLGELGRGGMSTVYLADDPRHERRVAIKVLHPELAAAIGPERFRREIRLAARLQHPHILPVFDSGETDGRFWFVMPFIEGESLRERLRRERRLPVGEAIRIAREIALALEYAHRHGVVHRDVKPENVLLGESGEVLLADFGIARALDAADTQLTGSGVLIGTPAYMSPEQAEGSREVDARSDQYGLGCVLYEMLTGEPPFTGLTPRTMLVKRITMPAPDVAALRDSVPPFVRSALHRALSTEPADRFPSLALFADALLGAASAEPEPQGEKPEPKGRSRRRRMPAAGRALIALAVVGLIWWGASRVASHRRPGVASAGSPRIVVLPFRNLGSPGNDYFADGLTEEVTSRLGQVRGLRVISRTSAMHYRQSDKTLRQIGTELGAGYVLEGSVRWEGGPEGTGRVRVTPRLVRASDDTQLWGDRYDAELADVFSVQADIAEAVAEALDVRLGGEERAAIAQRPTVSAQAHDALLRGNVYLERGWTDVDALDSAMGQYRRAVALDPAFGEAWARLSIAETMRFRRTAGPPESLLVAAKAAADTALRLAPDLGAGNLALGYYHYWGRRDYQRARAAFGAVLRRNPSDADALYALGAVARREGRWSEAVTSLCRGADLDPRSGSKAWDCGLATFFTRDYPRAERYFDRAIMVDPSNGYAYTSKARLQLAWHGDLPGARETLHAARGRVELATLASGVNDAAFLLADSSWTEQLEKLGRKDFEDNPIDYFVWRGLWYHARGESARERPVWDSLRVAAAREAEQHPGHDEAWVGLAFAYAGLGRAGQMRDAIGRAEVALPLSRDHAWGADRALYFAQCYARVGDADRAVAELEGLLSAPSPISPARLRVDPAFAPIAADARFRRLAGEAP